MEKGAECALQGIAWEWVARDGARTTAPLGGEKVGKTPTDRGKSGTTRRVRPDGHGVPLGLAVDGAPRHDCTLTRATIARIAGERPAPTPDAPQGRGVDTGYDEDDVRALLTELGCTAHIRARGEEAQALQQEAGLKARRWVVESSHR